jgi:phage terminase small subunit
MPELKNRRQELFCRAYVLEPIAVKAAVKAGYRNTYADETQRRLMRMDHVQARIAELREPEDTDFKIKVDAVLRRLWTIATCDARDLTQLRIGPCR